MSRQLRFKHLDELGKRASESRRQLVHARQTVAALREKAADLRMMMLLAGTPVGWREYKSAHDSMKFLENEIAETEADLADLNSQRARIVERSTS